MKKVRVGALCVAAILQLPVEAALRRFVPLAGVAGKQLLGEVTGFTYGTTRLCVDFAHPFVSYKSAIKACLAVDAIAQPLVIHRENVALLQDRAFITQVENLVIDGCLRDFMASDYLDFQKLKRLTIKNCIFDSDDMILFLRTIQQCYDLELRVLPYYPPFR